MKITERQFKKALHVMLQCATNDVRGSGLGYRSTNDEWRKKVSVAFGVVWNKLHGYWPGTNDFYNNGMQPSRADELSILDE